MVAFVCTHFPATSGVTAGAAWRSDTGAEKVSEIVVSAGTFCAPAAGLVDFNENEAPVESSDAPDPEPEPDLEPLELDAAVPGPECAGPEEPKVKNSTTATTMAAPTSSTHGRRRNGLPARDS